MSYCSNCGTQLVEGARYCHMCARPVPGGVKPVFISEAPAPVPEKSEGNGKRSDRRSRTASVLIVIALAVVFLTLLVSLILVVRSNTMTELPEKNSAPAAVTAVLPPESAGRIPAGYIQA